MAAIRVATREPFRDVSLNSVDGGLSNTFMETVVQLHMSAPLLAVVGEVTIRTLHTNWNLFVQLLLM